MAGWSDQIAIPIGSDRDREKKDRSKIDRMIAIPLDQSYFKIFKCFLAYTKFNYKYNKYITIDKVSLSTLYIRDNINDFNRDESVLWKKHVHQDKHIILT